MKQILQSLKTGSIEIASVPVPLVSCGHLLISTSSSLVSAGTERMLLNFGKAGWIKKVTQQPDKVRTVLGKIKSDGLIPAVEAVRNKLDQPLPLGYSNVGIVTEIGGGVYGFNIGDRVASNGKHAEVTSVPTNLVAKIPDNVTDEEASFTILAAIALQGIRLAQPTLGETVVVTGLGLIGLLAVQLLKANGCRVIGLDFDRDRLELARQFGAEIVDLAAGQDPITAAELYTRGRGVDAVIITATTKSNEPMRQAALMCRKRGRIILVGVAGLKLSREDFFKKELTFQVSASYGPGRYDINYEEKGHDYPVGFVRWTEQRNFEAVLDMMADERIDVKPLISHRFSIDDAEKAYTLISGNNSSLGVLLKYPGIEITSVSRVIKLSKSRDFLPSGEKGNASVSFIGAGNYATGTLIPAFKEAGAHLRIISSSAGVTGLHAGRKYGFEETTTDLDYLFSDRSSNTVTIATQHNTHAHFVLRALKAGKNVFVEKPLCLTLSELRELEVMYQEVHKTHKHPPLLMVGFNRRFAPQVKKMKQLLDQVSGSKAFVLTINSGAIPADHWTQDPEVGGGRIVGEACHFIDLLRFMAGSPIESWSRVVMNTLTTDTLTISLKFIDGSIGTVHYLANGNKDFPKESLQVFASGRILQLDNYRKLTGFGWPGFKKMNLWRQDKGQKGCVKAFIGAISNGSPSPIPFNELLEVSRVSIEVAQ